MASKSMVDWTKFLQQKPIFIDVPDVGRVKIKPQLSAGDMSVIFENVLKAEQLNPFMYGVHMIWLLVLDDNDNQRFGSIDQVLELPASVITALTQALDQLLAPNLNAEVEDAAKK